MKEHKRIMNGSKAYIVERICRTYVETGRTVRSLARLYNCSKTSIERYINEYAQDTIDRDLYCQVRRRAIQNKQEVYEFGCSENRNSDMLGSMD